MLIMEGALYGGLRIEHNRNGFLRAILRLKTVVKYSDTFMVVLIRKQYISKMVGF